jgi:hypothetical protein
MFEVQRLGKIGTLSDAAEPRGRARFAQSGDDRLHPRGDIFGVIVHARLADLADIGFGVGISQGFAKSRSFIFRVPSNGLGLLRSELMPDSCCHGVSPPQAG